MLAVLIDVGGNGSRACVTILNPPRPRWPAQLLEARTPVQKLMLSNKVGKASQVAQLPVS